MNRYRLIFIVIATTLAACSLTTEQRRYEAAIEDAIVAEPSEICSTLTAINHENKNLVWGDSTKTWLLVANWTKHPERFSQQDTIITEQEIWVTVVPELKNYMLHHKRRNPEKQLEELLGLPPKAGYTHLVEIWVKPASLFRPTPDPDINDSVAELEFPAGTDSVYIRWFNENAAYSYHPHRYPWTRLGYTYNWGRNQNEIGLSEFVIRKNSKIVVRQLTPTREYFNTK